MNKDKFCSLLKKIPKAELHLHTEALITKEAASKILSHLDRKYLEKTYVDQLFRYDNLKGFINVFLLLQSAFHTLEDFKVLFCCIAPYLKRNGIVYAELFFAPSNFLKNGLKFQEIIDLFIHEIAAIKEKKGIIVKIIIDVSRTFGVKNAEKNLKYALECKSCKDIIGIGLGGDELKGPAKDFQSVFKKAKEAKINCVAHAGEDVGPESVWDAINYLGAQRIGHGISSIYDPELVDYLVNKQLPLEVCPTSNLFTKRFVNKMEDHPIRELFNRGVLVTLNTDDPTFFNIELVEEYWNLYSKLDFSLNDIKKLIINGFQASFMNQAQKKEYINQVQENWNKYF